MAAPMSVENFFEKLLLRSPELQAVLVTDHDGVELIKAVAPAFSEDFQTNSLATVFAVATEQANKWRMGANKMIISYFDNHVVVHMNDLPLIITVISGPNANTGILMSLAPEIKQILHPIRESINVA